MPSPLHITPFSIHVEEEALADLRTRIRNTRWPDPSPGDAEGGVMIAAFSAGRR